MNEYVTQGRQLTKVEMAVIPTRTEAWAYDQDGSDLAWCVELFVLGLSRWPWLKMPSTSATECLVDL